MKAMNRSVLAVVVAMGVVGMLASSAMAAKGLKKGGEPKAVEQIRTALAKLNLSEDQQKQTDDVLNDLLNKMQEAKASAKGGDRDAAKQKGKEAMMEAREKLMKILDKDQQAKFREEMKEARAERKAKGDGASSSTTQPAQ